jgi:hypothetical protein
MTIFEPDFISFRMDLMRCKSHREKYSSATFGSGLPATVQKEVAGVAEEGAVLGPEDPKLNDGAAGAAPKLKAIGAGAAGGFPENPKLIADGGVADEGASNPNADEGPVAGAGAVKPNENPPDAAAGEADDFLTASFEERT